MEDEAWRLAAGRYRDFLREHEGARLLFLELGVGWNTPGIIKYSFQRMAARNKRAVYTCINLKEVRGWRLCGRAGSGATSTRADA